MTLDAVSAAPSSSVSRERRLANLRATLAHGEGPATGPDQLPARAPFAGRRSAALAARLAAVLGAEAVETSGGTIVRRVVRPVHLPLDRERLASLPGQPPRDAPIVCLDTETTGLATAAGTLAFLVGLARWEGDAFRQTQLLLPDHADEPALLAEIDAWITPDTWLVSYNGRGFDWPLLEARFRLAGRAAPAHAGHADLLPLVRRVFRHRMENARLRTVEGTLLGVSRDGDVEGWEIPGIYLDVLRGGAVEGLAGVVVHNEKDVKSLGLLLAHVEQRYAAPGRWAELPRADLAGLARAYLRERRHEDALACLDDALAAPAPVRDPFGRTDAWWAPAGRPDFGGRPPRTGWRGPLANGRGGALGPAPRPSSWDTGDRWTDERLAAERGRVLGRVGRWTDAADAWHTAAAAGGALGAIAWIEVAKIREHRLGDTTGALVATGAAWRILERSRVLGRPHPRLEADLARRAIRLRTRIHRHGSGQPAAGVEPSSDVTRQPLARAPSIRASTAARSGTPSSP